MHIISQTRFSGLIGMIGSTFFLSCVIVLGFIQPGYNHLTNTVSYLAVGKYGFIQSINLLILALTNTVLGMGLGKSIHRKYLNRTSAIFIFYTIVLLLVTVFPTDKSVDQSVFKLQLITFSGFLHFSVVTACLILSPLLVLLIIQDLRQNSYWKKLVPYTIGVLISNFLISCLFYVFLLSNTMIFWKGLMQKVVIFNGVIWYFVISLFLYKHCDS
ncbi:hypothetical protein A2334_00960 [Candidatus Roizmanbacteria bacterium RIFOXYB2_FULL_38_10]|uniref:DUF998 domain-containing protein n=1 Tax=Candidatus Roizmanbacteria bacterium RIFOXYD1_FULL_38_12 TaxID=1802093 RepID=A0A1F7L1E9_9BACT|nr:MAG: hypothetical protein A3K47_04255 [Candidatus Roizmanbacteria bacterium RIFOXYA2_FULL_38_14]OGK63967.1 MAG: hypothetical protein A3K27_04255 [Candidatus Roizmanbacteria bacterium RIFOXYA1_FULL_37_12]OGK65813.1 MAG: hypothetical protein A3K38_04255 [Candidatus Roizmanbacteria bacterium RIFOXYB1_FULL_40_23]OGK68921.1 MAG: hypothetical protein A2334_00960 [Candidatus Roizmanbacteria bacterium RIFOXYB2_FULL_38_10]OGK70218.1 MAG: hypothetical protein A3K21_04260 [Candidatus Roizmanbacteria ba